MKIRLAKTAGFCMGVRRAVQLALKTARAHTQSIYTLGPLIHNPQTIEMLEKCNVKVIKELNEVDHGIIIIRAHGVTPQKVQEVQNYGLEYEDATCPLVKRIQNLIKKHRKSGYHIALIGDQGHSEVVGLMGYAENHGTVIECEADIDSLPPGKICVVAQSTQNHKEFDRLVACIQNRFDEVVVFDTICSATNDRQNEVRELSQKVEAMVIVGGSTSANTLRLAEISRSMNVPTFLIESETELNAEQLKEYQVIGVTAGASTPNWVIEKVVDTIRQISHQNSGLPGRLMQLLDFIMKSELFLGLGAAFLYYACCSLLNLPCQILPMVTVGLVTFALHMLNHFTDPEYMSYRESYKVDFFQRRKKLLLGLGVSSVILAMIFALLNSTMSFVFISTIVVLGLIYSYRIVPNKVSKFTHFSRLRDIPASKDVGVAAVWGLLTCVYPLLNTQQALTPGILPVFLFTFTLVFVRSILLEIRDIQGDTVVNAETIPVLIGQKHALLLLVILLALTSSALILGSLLSWISSLGAFLLIPLAYTFLYLQLHRWHPITLGMNWELLVSSNFVLTLLMALLWNILH